MVRRAVDREVERDLHPSGADLSLEPGEILERPQRRFDRLVPAKLTADGVRHSRFPRLGRDRVVSALSIRTADRVNRRKINHVESHRLRVVHPRQTIPKG